MTSEELLWQWLRFGWSYRRISDRPQADQDWYAARVKYEMGLIVDKDFVDFFLITSDMVRFAKDAGIPVGPGRGSVAASVVSWLLRITEVDPHRYQGMLFERFIDVSRADPPDIDLDFADNRRHEVFEYMAGKYGSDCVGNVANFVRYRAKNSLVDIARVYQIPIAAKEIVSSLIIERSGGDSRFDSSLEDTVNMFPNARKVFDTYPKFWQACKLEGNVKSMSVHAAGMIMANTPLTDVCAVYERDGRQVLSIDKYDVEYAGMLKMDVLGLSTMGVIARCLELTGLTLENLYAIRDDDPATLAMFKSGDITGIFQFEGRATRLVNRDVSPDTFAHIADINALARPGPLFSGTTAEYVNVRHGRQKPTRLHPLVDDITIDTYGQIIYQEQILRILRDIGGFDWFSVGQIRRIISKKLGEAAFQMNYQMFADGAEKRGVSREDSDRIWKRLVTSGTYSFNIAHAISYSLLAFWCAWIKAHYPLEFYAASLSRADEEQRFKLMKDALAHGIDIKPPVIGVSRHGWTPRYNPGSAIDYNPDNGQFVTHHPDKGDLVAGWDVVPGIGAKMAERIGSPASWEAMLAIPGIGPKKLATIQAFGEADDPFGLKITGQRLARVSAWLKKQSKLPKPTHDGAGVAAIRVEERYGADAQRNYGKGPRVVYMGIVKTRNYQDIVENRRSRTGEEAEDILKSLSHPELLEYCSLRCYDATDEEVYLRVNRFKFPHLKRIIESITVDHDVVIAVGNRIAGFGTPVMVERLYVVDPD